MGNQIDNTECFNKKMCVKSIHSTVMHRRRPKKQFPVCINNIGNLTGNNVITNIMDNTIPPYVRLNDPYQRQNVVGNNNIPAIIVHNNRNNLINTPNNIFTSSTIINNQNNQNNIARVTSINSYTNTAGQGIITVAPTNQNNGCISCGQYNRG